MNINPQNKSVTYKIDELSNLEMSIEEIERIVLSEDSVNGDVARGICGELRAIRECLHLKRGINEHDKFKG